MTLGWLATLIGAAVLWVLGWIERRLVREFRARLTITLDASAATAHDLAAQLRAGGLVIAATTVEIGPDYRMFAYEILQNRTATETDVPGLVDRLAREPGVRRVRWRPVS
jgi:hypothetical protein